MSETKASSRDIFDFNVCSQCLQPFAPSASRGARHAVPCGHVFCKDCLVKVEAEQKDGKSVCRRAGCGRELASASEFAVSWAPHRAGRLKTKLEALLRDQGDVGARNTAHEDPEEALAMPSLCVEHGLPFQAAESSTHRPICSKCLAGVEGKVTIETFGEAFAALDSSSAAVSAGLAKQRTKLAEATFTADELCAKTAKWAMEETERIRAWEEREVKHIHAVANETVLLVQEVCARRVEVGASVLTQRTGLRVSLEELDEVLADLPSDPAARLSEKRAVYAERERLCELLAGSKIAVPSTRAVLEWAELPTLSAEFDQKASDMGGLLANAVLSAARETLVKTLGTPYLTPFHRIQDGAKGLRSIPMGKKKPNVFVGLDDDTVVVGFRDMSPLQVWDLDAGKVVREFDGAGQFCDSIITLPGGRVAAGWNTGSQYVVTVFGAFTGKQLQQLKGFGYYILGLALVEDHLLTMCLDKTLGVWSQDASGKFTEKAKFATAGRPHGAMTVLSPSTVAMSMDNPAQIEVWDWKAGTCVRTLTGFGGSFVFANALLPDGRLVVGDYAGIIRAGSLDDWAAAKSMSNGGSGIIGVVAGQDGSFVTTDNAGNIKLWRNGACEATVPGCYIGACYGVPLAVIDRRLIIVGNNNNLLVGE